MSDLAIIIVSFNCQESLRDCLRALPAGAAAVVVDNASAYDLTGTAVTHLDVDLGALRTCAPGRMQLPPAGPVHDGVDVLARLWGRP